MEAKHHVAPKLKTNRLLAVFMAANVCLAGLLGLLLVHRSSPGLKGAGDEGADAEPPAAASESVPEPGPTAAAAQGAAVAAGAETALPTEQAARSTRPEEWEDPAQKQARVRVPVTFAGTEAGLEGFNAAELAALERLRQRFVESVSQAGPDPASPEYLEAWLQAQEESDDRFSALFGSEAFVRQQILAGQRGELPQRH